MQQGNVTYQVERIEGDHVTVRETFDLTNRNGPGILMRMGQAVDCKAQGIVSAARLCTMTRQQAQQLGLFKADDPYGVDLRPVHLKAGTVLSVKMQGSGD